MSSPPITFRDVAESAGITFRLTGGATERRYLIETMPGGVAVLDFNADGRPDIFFANGATSPDLRKAGPEYSNRLFRNDGDGHFSDVTAEAGLAGAGYSIGAAAGDYDNDGRPDLFVTGVNEAHLYRNAGNGKFIDVTAQTGIAESGWSVAAGWLDYDNDGLLDLFVVNYVRWNAESNPQCRDPGDRFSIYCHPKYFQPGANALYHNRGNGKFENVSEKSGIARHAGKGMSVAFADYDRDGRTDIVVTNDTMPNFLFRNRGDGTFEEKGTEAGVALPDDGRPVSSMGVDFRDFDNDGLPDVSITALAGETFPLFRNTGKGFFTDATYSTRIGPLSRRFSGWSNVLADFDNDGWKDLFTANSHVSDNIDRFSGDEAKQANTLFRNLGNGRFELGSTAFPDAAKRTHRGAAIADFDGDGRLDIVVTAIGDRAELWRNSTNNGFHWLDIRLVGRRSNRDGLGAILGIGKQTNQQTSSVGYASSSLGPVHFGLGQTAEVEELQVVWPSGIRQVVKKIKADQILTVTETQTP